ncbi:MAG TPA: FAD-dependent oxidoreductase [Baekduia sp.]|nr:FAD-dependent oxidoreductase [Baekduia sp.]
MRDVDHLLIGGGIASASAAQELVKQGATSILLVGRELDPPYERPPATKSYLRGESSKQDALIDIPEPAEVLTRISVMNLDTEARIATLSNKEEVRYGSALIATGAMVRRPQIEGGQLDGIHFIRTLPNADSLREDIQQAKQVVIVGGSFIGVEVAASLVELGKQVTIVMLEDHPFANTLGERVGRWVRSLLEGHGIEVLGGAPLAELKGTERVESVELEDGRSIAAQAVVMGIGVTPDVMLARKAGLELGEAGGVKADAKLQTSAERLFVAGDIAEYESVIHGGASRRIEHFEVAAAQGRTAARNMMGAGETFAAVPYFWSDIADWATLECVGAPLQWDEERVDGDESAGAFSVRYIKDGTLVGALSIGGHGDLDAAVAELTSG